MFACVIFIILCRQRPGTIDNNNKKLGKRPGDKSFNRRKYNYMMIRRLVFPRRPI